jgi:hypothetical protein
MSYCLRRQPHQMSSAILIGTHRTHSSSSVGYDFAIIISKIEPAHLFHDIAGFLVECATPFECKTLTNIASITLQSLHTSLSLSNRDRPGRGFIHDDPHIGQPISIVWWILGVGLVRIFLLPQTALNKRGI